MASTANKRHKLAHQYRHTITNIYGKGAAVDMLVEKAARLPWTLPPHTVPSPLPAPELGVEDVLLPESRLLVCRSHALSKPSSRTSPLRSQASSDQWRCPSFLDRGVRTSTEFLEMENNQNNNQPAIENRSRPGDHIITNKQNSNIQARLWERELMGRFLSKRLN